MNHPQINGSIGRDLPGAMCLVSVLQLDPLEDLEAAASEAVAFRFVPRAFCTWALGPASWGRALGCPGRARAVGDLTEVEWHDGPSGARGAS